MAKSKQGFQYRGRERTTESVVRRSKQAGGVYDSFFAQAVSFYRPKEGENCVRILPPTWEDLDKWGDGWEVGIWLHYDVGPDKGSYLCRDKMIGEECPICEARREATNDDEADALRPTYRALCWVVDRDNEKAGPQAWSMPVTLFRDINSRSVDKKDNTPILIDDPEEGYDIIFYKEGTGLRTKYSRVEIDREDSPVHEDSKNHQRWLDYVAENPLPDMLQFYDADYISKVLFGKVDRSRSKDEDDEAPRGRRSTRRSSGGDEDEAPAGRRSRRRSKDEDEEVDDDDFPFDTDDEEASSGRRSRRRTSSEDDDGEEAPARGRRSRRSSKSEEDDDPEEEEEERPSGRRSRRTTRSEEEAEDDDDPADEDGEEDDEGPSGRARGQLDKLRSRRRSRSDDAD